MNSRGNLVDIGGLDVGLSAVGNPVLQHLLHPGHQEDICMRVGN